MNSPAAIVFLACLIIGQTIGQMNNNGINNNIENNNLQSCLSRKMEIHSQLISNSWLIVEIPMRRQSQNALLECSVRCLGDDQCKLFSVNEESKRCRLHRLNKMNEMNFTQSGVGFETYYTCRVPCENGWTFIQNSNKCIKTFGQTFEFWEAAQNACVEEGGRLLTIKDNNTQNAVEGMFTEPLAVWHWIGISDSDVEGQFKWVDGTPLSGFEDWSTGQPDDYLGKEDCGVLWKSVTWNDAPCDLRDGSLSFPYICEKRGPGCDHKNGGCAHSCADPIDGSWDVTCDL